MNLTDLSTAELLAIAIECYDIDTTSMTRADVLAAISSKARAAGAKAQEMERAYEAANHN